MPARGNWASPPAGWLFMGIKGPHRHSQPAFQLTRKWVVLRLLLLLVKGH